MPFEEEKKNKLCTSRVLPENVPTHGMRYLSLSEHNEHLNNIRNDE